MFQICGIVHLRNREIEAESIENRVNSFFESSGKNPLIWAGKNVALVQASAEAAAADSPRSLASLNLKIVADAVLTNRTELHKKFGAFLCGQERFTDHELILKAYEKWGENCPDYLAGDFAFAIWDRANRKLFCARDHFGASNLFYYKDSEKFVFGSNPSLILKFGSVEKNFNVKKLGLFLIPEPHTLLTDQSWFENISVLPAGTTLTIQGDELGTRKYWTPGLPDALPFKTEKEIIEAFRELLFEVIEERISNIETVASLLSGGLDSSSIVSVAAKVLEKQNRQIDVFSGVLDENGDSGFEDERCFIDQFTSFPNVNINYVTAPGAGPFSDLDEFFEVNDTPFVTSRHYLYTAFARAASESGATTLLDGAYGELGATSHGWGGFAELFSTFKWLTLWRELRLRKALYNDSVRYNIRANIVSPLLPRFIKNLRHGRLHDEMPRNKYNPVRDDLAERLLDKIDVWENVAETTAANLKENQLNVLQTVQKKMGENYSFSFTRSPIEIRFPLLDKRLIEFSSAVPIELKYKDGYYRYLIRVALDEVLPPKIQWRTTKTPFSPDYLRRYNSQIDTVRAFLADIPPTDPVRNLLDIEKIKSWADLEIDCHETDSTKIRIARDYLPQAVYLIYFLRKFSEFRA